MKRLLYRGETRDRAAEALFGDREDFSPEPYRRYPELEIVWQEDGRYSVWGNLDADEADLLQDTRRDTAGRIPALVPLASETLEEV